ncbi:MAG: hypothetical protein LBF12_00405, partial [Christensenellaceae bacterium]|nr:hypothetical protein [Christensenellaceae bacterium]
MTTENAKEVLSSEYHKDNLKCLYEDLLFSDYTNDIAMYDYYSDSFESVLQIGKSEQCGIKFFEVLLTHNNESRQVNMTQEMFKIMRGWYVQNAIVAFVTADKKNYRLSLLTTKYDLDENDRLKRTFSNPRRYSYSLGCGCKTKTAYELLIEKGRVNSLDELKARFSVEVVNK